MIHFSSSLHWTNRHARALFTAIATARSKFNEDLGQTAFGILEAYARAIEKKKKKRSPIANRSLVPEVVAGDSLDVYACHTPGTEVGAVSRRLKEGRQGFRAYLPLAVGHSQVALFFTFLTLNVM